MPRLNKNCRLETRCLSSDLWERLPKSLVQEEVLTRLPFSSLVRLGCVSKHWRNLIFSSKISPRCSSGPACLVYVRKGQLTVFNSTRAIWEPVSLPVNQVTLEDVVAAAGGLLCLSTRAFGKFIICNPVTKHSKIIPKPCWKGEHLKRGMQERFSFPVSKHCNKICKSCWKWLGHNRFSKGLLAGMIITSDRGHFKLIVAGMFPGSLQTTFVYYSREDSWEKVPDVPEFDVRSVPSKRHKLVACDGCLFLYWTSPFERKLLKYNVGQKKWSRIVLPNVEPRDITYFNTTIIEYHGKLLFIENLRIGNVVMMELQHSRFTTWSPAHLPSEDKISEAISGLYKFRWFGEGNVVFFLEQGRRDLKWRVRLHKPFDKTLPNPSEQMSWLGWNDDVCPKLSSFQTFRPTLLPCN